MSLEQPAQDETQQWSPLANLDRGALERLAGQHAGAGGRLPHSREGVAAIDFQGGAWPVEPAPPAFLDVLSGPQPHSAEGTVWGLLEGAHEATAAARLRDPLDGVNGMLVRSGSWFAYARDRAAALLPGVPLAEQIQGCSSPAEAVALLDCEVSLGRIDHHGRWLIISSTLPHRIGGRPRPELHVSSLDVLSVQEVAPDGHGFVRTWQISEAAGLLHTLCAIEPGPLGG